MAGQKDSGAPAEGSCMECVIGVIEGFCKTKIGTNLDLKIGDICAPCNTGVLSDLETALTVCGPRVTLSCGLTVRAVIKKVCTKKIP